jgi:hypothetical protein
MAKKRRKEAEGRAQGPATGPQAAFAPVSRAAGGRSSLYWAAALVLILSGYGTLTLVDPQGKNIWAIFAPALLLGGYLTVIPAIISSYRPR